MKLYRVVENTLAVKPDVPHARVGDIVYWRGEYLIREVDHQVVLISRNGKHIGTVAGRGKRRLVLEAV